MYLYAPYQTTPPTCIFVTYSFLLKQQKPELKAFIMIDNGVHPSPILAKLIAESMAMTEAEFQNRSRKDARPANGTLTLRRTSTTPFAQAASQGDAPLHTPGADIQQHPSTYEQSTDTRYSKSQLLDIFRSQEEMGALQGDVSRLYVDNWNPEQSNGANGRSGWGKSNDGRETYGPEICWDTNGQIRPVGLEEMSEQEKIVRN